MTVAHVEGAALFSGQHAGVSIEPSSGPTTLQTSLGGGPLAEWSREPAFRTTSIVHASGARLACVEHLFAALAAFGAHENISITVEGTELPILDGAAVAWCTLLAEVGIPKTPSHLVITRDAELALDDAKYLFFSDEIRSEIGVEIELGLTGEFARTLATCATWAGDRDDFVMRIAPARTFVSASDLDAFAASGAGAHLSAESFVVVGESGAVAHGRPFSSDEPARHKLLDLIGDFFLWGGPPRGRVEALRPGHAKNHRAIAQALELGILKRI